MRPIPKHLMAPPGRFRGRDQREKREVTPFEADQSNNGVNVVEDIPAEWRHVEAPPNFTWVGQDELAGMGWPKSRDQVRFLVERGIDHLVTLSADKIPPHYAFPDLKWSLIPVEDFHGPAIGDIRKFLNIMDEARANGEAVAVHCAEGRGRTGVMCACFLIYYYDLKPWDAIRIMRRQRPGSVERKVQEDTVVRFYNLLEEFGKQALEDLEAKEKLWKEQQRREREHQAIMNCENILTSHTASFYGPGQRTDMKVGRLERIQRMRRCRSMPKMSEQEEEAEKREMDFRRHVQTFLMEGSRHSKQPKNNDTSSSSANSSTANDDAEGELDRRLRAVTPGRSLLDGLKKPKRRSAVRPSTSFTSADTTASSSSNDADNNADFTKHFKDFMAGNSSSVKRARSFSQPKDKSREEEEESASSTKNEEDVEEEDVAAKQETASNSSSSSSSDVSSSDMSTSSDVSACSSRPNSAVISSKDSSVEQDDDEDDDDEVIPEAKNEDKRNSTPAERYLRRRRLSKENKIEGEDKEEQKKENGTTKKNSLERKSADRQTPPASRPPQPSYTPKYTIDSASSTYSYYTRVRSRAAERRAAAASTAVAAAAAAAAENAVAEKKATTPHSRLDPLRRRAKTVDRDMHVTVTVTESYDNDNSHYHQYSANDNDNYNNNRHNNNHAKVSVSYRRARTGPIIEYSANDNEKSKSPSVAPSSSSTSSTTSTSLTEKAMTPRTRRRLLLQQEAESYYSSSPSYTPRSAGSTSTSRFLRKSSSPLQLDNATSRPTSCYSPFSRSNNRYSSSSSYSRFLVPHSTRETFV